MLSLYLDFQTLTAGWIHHSTNINRSRGCEKFESIEECTWIKISNVRSNSMVLEWKLPSDEENLDRIVTKYPQVCVQRNFDNNNEDF